MKPLLCSVISLICAAQTCARQPGTQPPAAVPPSPDLARSLGMLYVQEADGSPHRTAVGAFIADDLFVTWTGGLEGATAATVHMTCCGEFKVLGVAHADIPGEIAVLQVEGSKGNVDPLPLATSRPAPGDSVRLSVLVEQAGIILPSVPVVALRKWPTNAECVQVRFKINPLVGSSPVIDSENHLCALVVIGGGSDTSLATLLTPDNTARGELVPLAQYAARERTPLERARLIHLSGIEQSRQHHWSEAIKDHRDALALEPHLWHAQWQLGVAIDESGRTEESIPALEKARDLVPEYCEPHNSLGFVHLKLHHPEAAAENFRRAIEADPKYAAAYSMLGGALNELGRFDEAIASMATAVDIDPGDKNNVHNLALLLTQQGKLDKIPDAWVKYCDRVPSDPDGWRRLGAALDDAGKPDRAIKMLSVGVDTNPDDIDLRLVFAAMLGKQGHTEDALKQVDRILQRKPNHRTALQLRALLTDELGPDNKK